MMDFFCFLIWGFVLHFIAFGLSPSGLGYELSKSLVGFAFLSQMNSFSRKERGFVRPHFYFCIIILF